MVVHCQHRVALKLYRRPSAGDALCAGQRSVDERPSRDRTRVAKTDHERRRRAQAPRVRRAVVPLVPGRKDHILEGRRRERRPRAYERLRVLELHYRGLVLLRWLADVVHLHVAADRCVALDGSAAGEASGGGERLRPKDGQRPS